MLRQKVNDLHFQDKSGILRSDKPVFHMCQSESPAHTHSAMLSQSSARAHLLPSQEDIPMYSQHLKKSLEVPLFILSQPLTRRNPLYMLFPCLFSQCMHIEVQGPGLIQLSDCSICSLARLKGAPSASGAWCSIPEGEGQDLHSCSDRWCPEEDK